MRFGKNFDSDAAMDDMRQSMLSKFLARKSDWNDDDESPGRKKIAFIVGGIALALFSLYLAGFIVMIQKESLPYTMMQSPLMHYLHPRLAVCFGIRRGGVWDCFHRASKKRRTGRYQGQRLPWC